MEEQYILALDQGTTSSRALLINHAGKVCALAKKEFPQYYPQPGWVEHDPLEIWASQSSVMAEVLALAGVGFSQIAAIGLTNQRETTVVWDRTSGKPFGRALVWQDRRTAPLCAELKAEGWEPSIREKTGLVLDAYFSGTKLNWILRNNPRAKQAALMGNAAFGTIDSWILWNLSGGKIHSTDPSNASRTLLWDIRKGQWDSEILEKLEIPSSVLPQVMDSSGLFGYSDPNLTGGIPIPICGVAGDQQAALFGQGCWQAGLAKNTYGTGCFLLMNTGASPLVSKTGLITTVAWGLKGKLTYALEGSVFIAGAAVQWVRDELGLIESSEEMESLARSVPDNGGVFIVPAFAGLGAPYWNMEARGAIFGLTRGAGKAHLARAVLESMAYQTRDLVGAMEKEGGLNMKELRVDGGASVNGWLMQFQADMLGQVVERPENVETTAMGAAYLAGLGVGFWTWEDLDEIRKVDQRFVPQMDATPREALYAGWKRAVRSALVWAKGGWA